MKKGHLPSLLSPETDRILFRNPSNNIPKIILMIDDPVIDLPSSLPNTFNSNYIYEIVSLSSLFLDILQLKVRAVWVPYWHFNPPCSEICAWCQQLSIASRVQTTHKQSTNRWTKRGSIDSEVYEEDRDRQNKQIRHEMQTDRKEDI